MMLLAETGRLSPGSVPTWTMRPPRRVAARQVASAAGLPAASMAMSATSASARASAVSRCARWRSAPTAPGHFQGTVGDIADDDARARRPGVPRSRSCSRMVPPPGNQDRCGPSSLPRGARRAGRWTARLGAGQLAQRNIFRHRRQLPFAHDETFAEHALHVRIDRWRCPGSAYGCTGCRGRRGSSRSGRRDARD